MIRDTEGQRGGGREVVKEGRREIERERKRGREVRRHDAGGEERL